MRDQLSVPAEGMTPGDPAGRAVMAPDDRPRALPVLKWAGGKRQMLPQILAHVPKHYGRLVEPMVGGGAVFFALDAPQALISDANPELINLYRMIVSDLAGLSARASEWDTGRETFYAVRALDFAALDPVTAAARTLYLNRTCFNGLFRVNRQGRFNVPYGRYRNPRVIDPVNLAAAQARLARAEIRLGDYRAVLEAVAREGDLVFLDPPYLPISEHADFKRYTKEQFALEDHHLMRDTVEMLRTRGATTMITNSNHPLMHQLYDGFQIEVHGTRRNINARAGGRRGEDILIVVPPRP